MEGLKTDKSSRQPYRMRTGEEPLVLRSDQGAVTTLTLNRPRQFNALSSAMLAALQDGAG